MATRRLSGLTTSSSVPDNGGDHSGGGGSAGGYVDDVFSTYVYEGTDGDLDIVNGVDLDGEGGMVWFKVRTSLKKHLLFDTEQGTGSYLDSSSNAASAPSNEEVLRSFNNDGFSISNGYSGINKLGEDFVSWTFRKQPKFFDVVTYTGDNVAGREIPHNLGCEPGMIIVKCTTLDQHWAVWHRLGPSNRYFLLNLDWQGVLDSPPTHFYPFPTDTHFQVGIASPVNGAGLEYVAYVFAHDDSDESMIKCGGYKSTNSTEEIELGWEPQFLLIKCASVGGAGCNWQLLDCMRGPGETSTASVIANTSDKEYDVDPPMAVATAKGFKLVTNSGENTNGTGRDYIYMAIRRPNKPAEEFEADELFAIDGGVMPSDDPRMRSGFPVDMAWLRGHDYTSDTFLGARLTQEQTLRTNSNVEELQRDWARFDYMNGYVSNYNVANQRSWMWRRAPGFFDVVAYEGDGSSPRVVPHNLGAKPEMIWMKVRSGSLPNDSWQVLVEGSIFPFEDSQGSSFDLDSRVTETTLTVNSGVGWLTRTNADNNNYIAYLFASVPGISAIGTYTGDGSGYQVIYPDGLSGASIRFVLVKRVDGNGNWIVFDRERGTDAALALNLSDAQKTGDFWSWTFGAFGVKSNNAHGSEWNPNIDGAEYIYMAIA